MAKRSKYRGVFRRGRYPAGRRGTASQSVRETFLSFLVPLKCKSAPGRGPTNERRERDQSQVTARPRSRCTENPRIGTPEGTCRDTAVGGNKAFISPRTLMDCEILHCLLVSRIGGN
ncbi:hypothetical protein NDU88_006855 [Pleurodeles waltl]|uniref:Uncharacterized protein n=1 Tax=Pleurodeles waltl TaxID=8319 RepID=A0AAV7PML1_PLEWA|nr:hypothetical protein NDU88_006855 [Pleurodeles waltl]